MKEKIVSFVFTLFLIIICFIIPSCNLVTKPDQVEPPILTPPPGNYSQSQQVSIVCGTDNAEIRYTTDGSVPPINSNVYNGPFEVVLGTTIKAIATKPRMKNSDVVTAFYSGIVPTPEFETTPGTYSVGSYIKIRLNGQQYHNGQIPGLSIRYTMNGSEPVAQSTEYVNGIQLLFDCTIKLKAFRYNWNPSITVSATYSTAVSTVDSPHVVPDSGVYLNHIIIQAECSTPSAQIHYTLDGSEPNISSLTYSQGISIDSSCVLKMKAFKPYWTPSQTVTKTYTIHTFSIIGSIDTPEQANDVAVNSDFVYIADGSTGLRIINIHNPTNPYQIGYGDTPGYARGVEVVNHYAYVADNLNGIQVFNAGIPASPIIVGNCNTPGYAYDIEIVNNVAFVADAMQGLAIIDVSSPGDPTMISICHTPGQAYGLEVFNNYVLVACWNEGLQIVDVHNLDVPVIIGSCSTAGLVNDVAVNGEYAYLATGIEGLSIVDFSDVARPVLISNFDTPGNALGICCSNNFLYIADGESGVHVYNVSNPALPCFLGSCDTPGSSQDIEIIDDLVFVADGISGLQIINFGD